MYYPFLMYGRVVQIHRYSVNYTETQDRLKENGSLESFEVERTEYFHTLEAAKYTAEQHDAEVTTLDSSDYEWLDALEVADVPDTYAEGYLSGNSSKKDELGCPADLDLSLEMIRCFVINDKAGQYD